MIFQVISIIFFLNYFQNYLSLTIKCPGASSNSCKCQSTEGISCPAGYYCPGYSTDTINSISDLIETSNCTVRNDGQLQCPCTPGFYCPTNTLTPSYCCAGHYCPTPAEIKECKAGYFCKTGYVEGLPCGSKNDCPAGSEYSNRSAALFMIIGVAVALYLIFLVKYFLEAKVREAKDTVLLMLKADKAELAEEISQAGVERMSVNEFRPLSVQNSPRKPGTPLNPTNSSSPNSSPNPTNPSSPKSSFSVGKAGDELAAVTPKSASDIDYTIEFEDISLILPNGVQIMKGVTGKFLPRRLCAIMGPSGAGKTTIISLVTGKAIKTGGTIKVNGQIVNDLSKWKKLVGFVPQEDVMIRQLTVRDNIEFSANYRLPVEMTKAERTVVVNETLIDLGIEHVQFSIIGDERERGVSGGQRKRVNIGIELVALPKVLFLDEPTSGLDSTSSAVLARQLKDIANRRGVTIASVIHQPSIQTFLEFDDLLLLGKGGQVVYHGPINEAAAYFASIGFKPSGLTNPADFYLDIANGAVQREGDPEFLPPHLFRFWDNKLKGRPYDFDEVTNAETGPSNSIMKESLLVVETNSPNRQNRGMSIAVHSPEYASRLNDETNPSNFDGFVVFFQSIFGFFYHIIIDFFLGVYEAFLTLFREITRTDEIRNTPRFLGQLFYCFKRAFKQKYRRFGAFLSQMLIHLGVALVVSSVSTDLQYVGPLPDVICATVTRDLYDQCTSPLSDSYQGTANFLCFGTIFAAISISAGTFGNEQVNYWRESAAGLKTAPYFIAKWIIEVPNIILAALFFWLAFTARFPNTNTPGDLYELFLAMYWWAWSLGFLLSAVAPPKNVFLVGVLVALLLAVGFSGANPTINEVQDLPPGIRWLWRVSGTRWALEAFYVSQTKYYEKVPSGPLEDEPYMNIDAGLDKIGYNIDNFNYAITALFWNGFGYAILAMIIMRFTNRDKKK